MFDVSSVVTSGSNWRFFSSENVSASRFLESHEVDSTENISGGSLSDDQSKFFKRG